MLTNKSRSKTTTYYISGMHCGACEILIEKKLIKQDVVEMVDVSLTSGTVTLEFNSGKQLSPKDLDKMFSEDGYHFSSNPFKHSAKSLPSENCELPSSSSDPFNALLVGAVFIIGYILLSRTGFSTLVSVNSQSSLPIFFLFGLLAGVSSCAALVGGIILSLSKQWVSQYQENDSLIHKSEPHFLFNIGRVLGYAGFGLILGTVGNFFRLSPLVSAMLVIGVSLIMILLGLQMIGVRSLQHFQIRLPKSFTGNLSDENNFRGRFGPFLMGALTFFLPCGFTLTAQSLALASGNALQGAMIMGLFALGTVPGLLAIGLGSVKLYSNHQRSKQFSLVAGMLVLFFAAFNINAQLSVLGVSNVNDFISNTSSGAAKSVVDGGLPPLVNGVQVVKIDATASSFTPSLIRLRANTPTRWEVNAISVSGCTNAIISRGLFVGQIDLVNGQVATKEFTSPSPGSYKYSCWMGMVSGTVEVVDSSGSTGVTSNVEPVGSGAQGCGCGGGGGTICGGIQ